MRNLSPARAPPSPHDFALTTPADRLSRPLRPFPAVTATWDDGRMSRVRESVHELDAESAGVWWVTTASGTIHVWDMDHGTVLRAPNAMRPLRFDGEWLPIALVTRYPRVGDHAAVTFPHPDDPERAVVRTSTRVVRIERAAY